MRDKEIVLAQDGTIIAPAFHDARLIGMLFSSDKRVVLLVRDIKNVVHCIAMNGVERFRSDDIREGNIILDITVHSGKAVISDDVAYVLDLINKAAYDNVLTRIMTRFKAKELLLVKLNPSYGGSLICICTSIEIVPTCTSELASVIAPPILDN